jgi:hypothetical protein
MRAMRSILYENRNDATLTSIRDFELAINCPGRGAIRGAASTRARARKIRLAMTRSYHGK